MNGSDCPTGKQQFATRAAAGEQREALRALHREKGTASRLFVGRCLLCGCFHVGNYDSRAARRERRARALAEARATQLR